MSLNFFFLCRVTILIICVRLWNLTSEHLGHSQPVFSPHHAPTGVCIAACTTERHKTELVLMMMLVCVCACVCVCLSASIMYSCLVFRKSTSYSVCVCVCVCVCRALVLPQCATTETVRIVCGCAST